MFQSFIVNSDASQSNQRIIALRSLMVSKGIDAYLVPLCDEHQGEYIAPYAQRLQWLTGFTGSAGLALILTDEALLFTDGRYQLQIREQTDNSLFTYKDSTLFSPLDWIKEHGNNLTIAIDPWLHTIAYTEQLQNILLAKNSKLVYLTENLIDLLWTDQLARPAAPISLHGIEYSGKPAQEKIAELQTQLAEKGQNNLILTDTTSIAWLFNIRGKDVEHTPITLAFACIDSSKKPILFIDPAKLTAQSKSYLANIGEICDICDFIDYIAKQASAGESFTLDMQSCCKKIHATIIENGGKVIFSHDPIRLTKSIKNTIEIAGARAAHIRDGVALVRFLAWLERQNTKPITEIDAAKKLEEYRIITAKDFNTELQDISFDTISGSGKHGAIIHYRVTEKTNTQLKSGDLYLIDSGGQYLDGTTDVTRTIALGEAGTEERRCFTLVLKGMINLSNVCFPAMTKGAHLDVLARYYLWQNGLDYAHGTGHGVGSYLSVHEGPQSISRLSDQVLLANMILSNEPGYYKAEHFGIRIENLLLIQTQERTNQEEFEGFYFETLTLCPIDQKLIDKNLLSEAELSWLNEYHYRVYQTLSPHLNEKDAAWLLTATKAL